MNETPPVETPTETPPETPPAAPPAEPAPQPPETPPTPAAPEAPPEAPPARVVPTAAEYTVPENIPGQVREFAETNDFTQEQLNATLKYFSDVTQTSAQNEMTSIRDAGKAHIQSWGDQKDKNLNLAKRALQLNDPEGKLAERLKTTGMINHPEVLQFLVNIGSTLQEGGFIKSETKQSGGSKTPAQALFGKTHPSEDNN